jgi:uncharacterized protein (DUF2235 family)
LVNNISDTVASVGLVPRHLPFVGSNSSIRYFRHALSLDEHRAKFAPSYYKFAHDPEDDLVAEANKHLREQTDATLVGHEDVKQSHLGGVGATVAGVRSRTRWSFKKGQHDEDDTEEESNDQRPGHSRSKHSDVWIYETFVNQSTGLATDSQEVFFAGSHCGQSLQSTITLGFRSRILQMLVVAPFPTILVIV